MACVPYGRDSAGRSRAMGKRVSCGTKTMTCFYTNLQVFDVSRMFSVEQRRLAWKIRVHSGLMWNPRGQKWKMNYRLRGDELTQPLLDRMIAENRNSLMLYANEAYTLAQAKRRLESMTK